MDNKKTTFELWPAIDLMGGAPVRLTKGDFGAKDEYDVSFEDIVKQFETFAFGIHIIDLDGAQSGAVQNSVAVETILGTASLPVQLGGGLRTFESIKSWLELGVGRVIIGTKALTDPGLMQRLRERFRTDQIVMSVDVKQGKVMTKGWTESNEVGAFEFMASLVEQGFQNFMVTDIEQDGTLQGASVELYKKLKNQFPQIYLLAAGGVGSLQDLEDLKSTGISGAIFGKAFYEGKISVEDLNAFTNAC